MRLLNIEDSTRGHGYKIALICLNVNELALLQGMASEIGETLPKRGPTARLRSVARQMSSEMGEAIKELDKSSSKQAKLLYPEDSRSIL